MLEILCRHGIDLYEEKREHTIWSALKVTLFWIEGPSTNPGTTIARKYTRLIGQKQTDMPPKDGPIYRVIGRIHKEYLNGAWRLAPPTSCVATQVDRLKIRGVGCICRKGANRFANMKGIPKDLSHSSVLCFTLISYTSLLRC